MAEAIEKRAEGVGALRLCICGGAPLSDAFQDRWATLTGVELRQGYGLTEAGPVSLFNSVDAPNQRGALGKPFPGVEVDLRAPVVFDASGFATERAHRDDEGEICVRGENVFRGYVSGGERGLLMLDGWLHTGDLGRRDSAGNIHFAGVLKSMFTRNGFNIYPREIERVVGQMSGVKSARVTEIVVPDDESEIALEVAGSVTEDEVKQWCAERLSVYKQPSIIALSS
jgi:long-chain acyl-CoA synthetase